MFNDISNQLKVRSVILSFVVFGNVLAALDKILAQIKYSGLCGASRSVNSSKKKKIMSSTT